MPVLPLPAGADTGVDPELPDPETDESPPGRLLPEGSLAR
jgi:hypothetical protein